MLFACGTCGGIIEASIMTAIPVVSYVATVVANRIDKRRAARRIVNNRLALQTLAISAKNREPASPLSSVAIYDRPDFLCLGDVRIFHN